MNFQKEWFKSGFKAWPYALLDLITFSYLLFAIQYDYVSDGFSQLSYSVSLIFFAYLSFIFNDLFFKKVVDDMKSKGFFKK